MMKNINYLDHPYWIPKCLNVGQISIPLQIFPYIYFPQIFTQIGCMIENVKIPIDHHTSGGSRISPRRGCQLPRGGANIRFCQIFPKTAWNWKNLDPRGGGGTCPKFYYVDPPLHTILVFWLFQNLLILSHLSESFDVPAGCFVIIALCTIFWQNTKCALLISELIYWHR